MGRGYPPAPGAELIALRFRARLNATDRYWHSAVRRHQAGGLAVLQGNVGDGGVMNVPGESPLRWRVP